MALYKNNHYVPQWFLANFCNGNDELFYYSKTSPLNPIIHRNSKKIFSQDDLYVTTDASGNRDFSLERDKFDKLETSFQPIVNKLISSARANSLPRFTAAEKKNFDVLISNMWARSPDFHKEIFSPESLEVLYLETMAELETIMGPLPETKMQELKKSEVKSRIKKNAFVDSLNGSFDPTLDALAKRGVGIVVAESSKSSFMIGSYPVTKLTLPGKTKITDMIVEVWLPISHDVAVTIWGSAGQEKIVSVTQSQVRQINDNVYYQSTEIAGSSKELVSSYAKRHRKYLKNKSD